MQILEQVENKDKIQILSTAASLGMVSFITLLQCSDMNQWGEKQSSQ